MTERGTKRLVVLGPGLFEAPGGRVEIDTKTAAGLAAFAQRWPGEVVFVAGRAADRTVESTDHVDHDRPFRVEVADDAASTIRRLNPSVLLAPLHATNRELTAVAERVVWVADFPLRVRWEAARVDSELGRSARARTAAGLLRQAPTIRRMLRAGSGVQCNGPDTFAAYAPHSRNPLRFFDTRVTAAEITDATANPPAASGPLRLAFSGRWIAQKGVLDAVSVFGLLRERGVPATLSMLGGGALADEVRRLGADGLDVRGYLDFESEWVPFVRDHVDVMLLPHPQSDSASTFLEAMSCGAPVAGYANRYWLGLQALSGGGWQVRNGDQEALVDLLSGVAADRSRLVGPRASGLAFGAEHSFEVEFDRRVEHLLSVI